MRTSEFRDFFPWNMISFTVHVFHSDAEVNSDYLIHPLFQSFDSFINIQSVEKQILRFDVSVNIAQ
jgi:hypothetical protein